MNGLDKWFPLLTFMGSVCGVSMGNYGVVHPMGDSNNNCASKHQKKYHQPLQSANTINLQPAEQVPPAITLWEKHHSGSKSFEEVHDSHYTWTSNLPSSPLFVPLLVQLCAFPAYWCSSLQRSINCRHLKVYHYALL